MVAMRMTDLSDSSRFASKAAGRGACSNFRFGRKVRIVLDSRRSVSDPAARGYVVDAKANKIAAA